MTDESPRQIAIVASLEDLMTILRARADELGATRDLVDVVAGLATGHTGKLLAPVPVKYIGPKSMFPIIHALGMSLCLIEDLDGVARLARRAQYPPVPHRCGIRAGETYAKVLARMKRRILKAQGKRGAVASNVVQKRDPEKLAQRNRRAALARWRHARRDAGLESQRLAELKRSRPSGTRRTIRKFMLPQQEDTP